MGQATVFWIREDAIRHSVAQAGKSDSLLKEIGRRVLAMEPRSAWCEGGGPLPLFDVPSVFFPFMSFHSTALSLMLWTGNRLCLVPETDENADMFRAAHHMAVEIVGSKHVVLPISREQYNRYTGGTEKWANRLEEPMYASVYWMYEDFSRDFKGLPESKWPCAEVGAGVLNLMLSDWDKSSAILNHGNAISRACSFVSPEFAALVWGQNCLRLISDFEWTPK